MKRILILLLAVVAGAVAASANNSKLSNRTKLLVKAHHDSSRLHKRGVMAMVSGNDMVSAFVTVNDRYQDGIIENHGGVVRNYYESIGVLTVDVPVSSLEALATEECIVSVEVSSPVKVQMDKARVASNAALLTGGVAPFTHSYMANGVLLGIVDQEIQVNHINFYDRFDNKKLRIKRFLNQLKNQEYTDQESIEAAKYDTRNMSSGHATHVLGIAAGADTTTDYYGIAQFADLAVVATTGEDADLSDGVKYIFDYADEVNKPCVINISMGGTLGPHDGTETCNRVIESLVGPGRLVVAAAGNSGDMDMHVGKTLSGHDSLMTFQKLLASYWYDFTMTDIWGDTAQNYEVSFVVYDEYGDSIAYSTPFYSAVTDSAFTHKIRTAVGSNNVNINLDVATGVNQYNNRGNVYFEYEENYLPDDCQFGIIVRGDSGAVNMWTYDQLSEFTDNNMSDKGWSDGDADMTIGTGVGDTRNVITVGSYVSNGGGGWYGSSEEDVSSFSSKGPLTTGQMKPEVLAPGEVIVSSIPDDKNLMYSRTANTTVNGTKYYYGEMQGTSMSSPYCAGVVAAWLEAKPDLTYDEVVDILRHTSRNDRYTGTVPNNTSGYGKLNAYAGLIRILGLNADVTNVSAQQRVIGFLSDGIAHIAGVSGNVSVSVVNMSGKTLYHNVYDNVMAGEEMEIDMNGMPDGIYVISVNGENFKVIK